MKAFIQKPKPILKLKVKPGVRKKKKKPIKIT